MEKKYVFWDLDGTLFAFHQDATKEELYSRIYYQDLSPVIWTWMQLLELRHNPNQEHFVLTKYLNDQARMGKDDALDKMQFPKERRLYVPSSMGKGQYVQRTLGRKLGKDTILLDDYTANCIEWTLAGGTAIKVLNGINDTSKRWKGFKLSREGKLISPQILSDHPGILDDLIVAICKQALTDLDLLSKGKTIPGESEEKIRKFFKHTGYVDGELILRAYDQCRKTQ